MAFAWHLTAAKVEDILFIVKHKLGRLYTYFIKLVDLAHKKTCFTRSRFYILLNISN